MLSRGGGLSPRRRGNPLGGHLAVGHAGSIPAQAGEPQEVIEIQYALQVYPRAGGGTGVPLVSMEVLQGLSPRRRGNRTREAGMVRIPGSIPAQAGEPLILTGRVMPNRVYPRAGGGTDGFVGGAPSAVSSGLSPRRRGNPLGRGSARGVRGSIPAQAGEPCTSSPRGDLTARTVYPRAGGGTRGGRWRRTWLAPGSIPAQAGEPRWSTGNAVMTVAGLSPRRRGNLLLPTP